MDKGGHTSCSCISSCGFNGWSIPALDGVKDTFFLLALGGEPGDSFATDDGLGG